MLCQCIAHRRSVVPIACPLLALLCFALCGCPGAAEVEMDAWGDDTMTLRSTATTQTQAVTESVQWLVARHILHRDVYDVWAEELQRQITSRPDRYVRKVSPRRQAFYVELNGVQLIRDLVRVLFGEITPRLVVCTSETVLRRRPIPDPAVETELVGAFGGYGFQVVDVAQAERVIGREKLFRAAEGDKEALGALTRELRASLLVVGQSFAAECPEGGFEARVEVKVVETATARVLASVASPQAAARAGAPEIAAKMALQKGASEAKLRLVRAMLNAYGKPITRVRVLEIRTYGDVTGLQRALRDALKDCSVRIDSVDLTGEVAVLEVTTKEGEAAVAGALESNGRLRVTGMDCRRVECTFK